MLRFAANVLTSSCPGSELRGESLQDASSAHNDYTSSNARIKVSACSDSTLYQVIPISKGLNMQVLGMSSLAAGCVSSAIHCIRTALSKTAAEVCHKRRS